MKSRVTRTGPASFVWSVWLHVFVYVCFCVVYISTYTCLGEFGWVSFLFNWLG